MGFFFLKVKDWRGNLVFSVWQIHWSTRNPSLPLTLISLTLLLFHIPSLSSCLLLLHPTSPSVSDSPFLTSAQWATADWSLVFSKYTFRKIKQEEGTLLFSFEAVFCIQGSHFNFLWFCSEASQSPRRGCFCYRALSSGRHLKEKWFHHKRIHHKKEMKRDFCIQKRPQLFV